MSACNVWVAENRAVMLTDTVIYSNEGRITGFAQKAVPVRSWTGVISSRGNMWGLRAALLLAERFASFDEFLARTAPVIEAEHKRASLSGKLEGFFPLIEVTVAGWSEQHDRAMAFTLKSVAGDAPAYVWADVCDGQRSGFVTGPGIDSALEDWRLHRVGADLLDYETNEFDPVRHGLPLMEAQRRGLTDRAFFSGTPFHCVGGAVTCSILTRDGVEQEIIHDWHDRVGEPIHPAAVDDDAGPRVAPDFVPVAETEAWFDLRRRGLVDPVTLMPRNMARAS